MDLDFYFYFNCFCRLGSDGRGQEKRHGFVVLMGSQRRCVCVFLCCSPESCHAAAAVVRAGQGVLKGVAGLNVAVSWPGWCSRNRSPRLHRSSRRKDPI